MRCILFHFVYGNSRLGIEVLLVRDTPPAESMFCVLELTLNQLLSTCSTQEDPSQHDYKIADWGETNQLKQNKLYNISEI